MSSGSGRLQTGAASGFTKPPVWGMRWTLWRTITVLVVSVGWVAATVGRLHPVWVALPVVVLALLAFSTVYHVTLTRWVERRWSWWRRRRAATPPQWPAALDVPTGGVSIGVVSENETLTMMIELRPDPIAPSVVTDTEERTINTISIALLTEMMNVLDVELDSIDLLGDGFRAVGGFSDLYQQMTGPTPAAAARSNWIVLRMRLYENLAAIDRRGRDVESARRVAATTCLRAADMLAAKGIDAVPASAAQIDAVNAALHDDTPTVDHWSHMESRHGYASVYYADPAHISVDSPQWWTWTLAQSTSTLIRLSRAGGDTVNIAALVRYRTAARPPAPPVSRLGPLYGVQPAMWRQFRIGYLPFEAPIPSTLLAGADPVIPFGPTGPVIGSIGDPRDKASVHLPLAGPITVLCQTPLLLRQVALRASVTGRPLVVVTDRAEKWESIVAVAASGAVVESIPESLPDNALLVLDTDDEWPATLPQVTVLTNDEACDADIELVDADAENSFTLQTRTGLSARVRAKPTHEERRLLGVNPPAAPRAATRDAPALARPTRAARPDLNPTGAKARPAGQPRSPADTSAPAAATTDHAAASAGPDLGVRYERGGATEQNRPPAAVPGSDTPPRRTPPPPPPARRGNGQGPGAQPPPPVRHLRPVQSPPRGSSPGRHRSDDKPPPPPPPPPPSPRRQSPGGPPLPPEPRR